MGLAGKFALIALFLWCLQPAQADAGCGCQKPPPPISTIRPSFASPGDKIVLFAPGIEVGSTYTVTFQSAAQESVSARAKFRRDLADGTHKPQIIVEVPDLPPGPTSVTVSDGGTVILEVAEHEFTALQAPILLPEANRDTVVTCYGAAVGSDSTVYIPVDVSAIAERMIFTGRADGYRLMFGSDDITIYNTQGVLMQLLGPDAGEIYAIYDEGQYAEGQASSFTLAYDRHEFMTYRDEHAHEDGYGLDSADEEWHTDGTRHIDHDHLVIAIRGLVNGADLPVPGETPQFTFNVSTWLGDADGGGPTLVQDNCNDGSANRADHGRWQGKDKGEDPGNGHDEGSTDTPLEEDESGQQGEDDPGSGSGGDDAEDAEDPDGGVEQGDEGEDDPGSGSGGDDGEDAEDSEGGVEQGDEGDDGLAPHGGGDANANQPTITLCGAAPRTGCRITIKPGKAQLQIKDMVPDSRDTLVWKWVKGESTELDDFGSVMTTDSVALCMYDESGETPVLVFAATAPGGSTCSSDLTGGSCWRGVGKRSGSYKLYKYQNGTGTPDGIEKMLLKPGDAGKAKLLVMGRGENLDLPLMPLSLPVRVQLQAQTGNCWEATYSETGADQGDYEQFRGKAE